MIDVMRFSFIYYLRSYRYFAPLLIYLLAVIFVYGVVPNPIMPSFAFTSTLLFVISAWLSLGYIDVEDQTQQMITVVHSGNVLKYYIGKMMVLVSLMVVISVITTLYAVALDKFTWQPTFMEINVGILSHVSLSLLGITLAAFFTNKFFHKLNHSIVGVFLVIAVSLSGAGIIHFLPSQLAFAGWMLPPVYRVMDVFNNYETSSESEIALAILLPGVYSILLFSIFLKWMKKKLF